MSCCNSNRLSASQIAMQQRLPKWPWQRSCFGIVPFFVLGLLLRADRSFAQDCQQNGNCYNCATSPCCNQGWYFCGSELCAQCPPGTYMDQCTLSESCPTCSAGSYNPNSGSTSSNACVLSSPGSYCPSSAMSAQLQCTPGNFCPQSGLTAQVPCTASFYCSQPGLRAVSGPCNAGTSVLLLAHRPRKASAFQAASVQRKRQLPLPAPSAVCVPLLACPFRCLVHLDSTVMRSH